MIREEKFKFFTLLIKTDQIRGRGRTRLIGRTIKAVLIQFPDISSSDLFDYSALLLNSLQP